MFIDMSKKFSVQSEVLRNIMAGFINKDNFAEPRNLQHVLRILFQNLDEASVESIAHLMLTEKHFRPTKVGDYVRLACPNYHIGKEFEKDILEDMGLLHKGDDHNDFYVYGEVLGDNSWSSDNYNPFYSTIKVNLLYHDEEKNLKFVEHTVSPLHALKVNTGSIPYFKRGKQTELKFQEDGKDISTTITL